MQDPSLALPKPFPPRTGGGREEQRRRRLGKERRRGQRWGWRRGGRR